MVIEAGAQDKFKEKLKHLESLFKSPTALNMNEAFYVYKVRQWYKTQIVIMALRIKQIAQKAAWLLEFRRQKYIQDCENMVFAMADQR